MFEQQIVSALSEAEALVAAGEQGRAQQLLTRALHGSSPAESELSATAIARATALLISLDAGLLPGALLEEHIDRMHRLTAQFEGSGVAEHRAAAELARIEWIHSTDDIDAVELVEALRYADDFAERSMQSEITEIRRAGAEAAFSAQMVRKWLGQDPAGIAVGYESLALGLAEETDSRMRHIRISALHAAARFHGDRLSAAGSDHTDPDALHIAQLLRLVVTESAAFPPALSLRFAALLQLADHEIASGTPHATALAEILAALRTLPANVVRLRCQYLDEALARYPQAERDHEALAEWRRLLSEHTADSDPEDSADALEYLVSRGGDISNLSASDLAVLQLAAAATLTDHNPGTAEVRLRLGARIVETIGLPTTGSLPVDRAPRRNAAEAIRLSEELEHRFRGGASDPELRPILTRLALDRALRLSDLSQPGAALALLARVRDEYTAAPWKTIRHLYAQATYWSGRLLRETGASDSARELVTSSVIEFADDADPDVRVWAANTLYSAWRHSTTTPAEADEAFATFTRHFAEDPDPRIRRHEAAGRLNAAVRAHARGASTQATHELSVLLEAFDGDPDPDIVDTVRLARENLAVLALGAGSAASSGTPSIEQARTQEFRDRLYAADARFDAGDVDAAVQEWRDIAATTADAADPQMSVIRLAALDMWGGYLNDSRQWEALVGVARTAMLTRDKLDFRAERMRARAYLRFGIAQTELSEPLAAIAAYESLDGLVADSRDDEVATTRQQAVYNRAILIDELGDVDAAIAAYDHVLAVHAPSGASPTRLLRQVKALRNQALLYSGQGRIAEEASAHRRVLDLAALGGTELQGRARASAFALAKSFARLGQHTEAAQTYHWIRSQPQFGFTKIELRNAAAAQKTAEKLSRRQR